MASDDSGIQTGGYNEGLAGPGSKQDKLPEKSPPLTIVIVFIFLSTCIAVAGYFFYHQQKQDILRSAENELSTVANLKIRQIAAWHANLDNEAHSIFSNRLLSRNLQELFQRPQPPGIERDVATWLKGLNETEGYQNVLLYDAEGKLRLAVPARLGEENPHVAALIQRAITKRQIIFTDLHRDEISGRIHMSMVVPILRTKGELVRTVGVLVMEVDPERFLYPLIQSWPVPSETAETLLVRREGDEVVFLNVLRHEKNTALSLRFPLSDTSLPAAMAILGGRGVVYGRDYRNVRVVAVVGSIPGLPWYIVAKIDRQELYAPVYRRAALVGVIVLVALLASALSVMLWHRRQQEVYYRRLYETEVEFNVERSKAQEMIVQSEKRYRQLFENMVEGVAYCKMIFKNEEPVDFIYIAVNHAFETLTGLKDVVGRPVSEVIPGVSESDRELFKIYGRVALTGEPEKFEIFVNALKMWFSLSVYSPEKGYFVAAFEVINERKMAEQKLQEYMSDLKRSNEELQQFAYIASHDLQEPLRMISSYLQLIEHRYKGKLDKDADEFIGFAVDGANRLGQMITGLLAYSRVGTKLRPVAEVNSAGALGQAIANLKIAIEESGAIITTENLPVVRADELQLVQVFQNLLSNAIKFRRSDKPLVRVGAERKGTVWVFAVKDNGVGISPEYKDKVFSIFRRLHGREYPGVGIGLSLCRRIVERHGGRIWFESERGEGTTFYFTIPERRPRRHDRPGE